LQLLDSEQLEYAFAAHGISREEQARKFYGDLWDYIKRAEKIHDPMELSRCESEMRKSCSRYFSLMGEWCAEEEEKCENDSVCPASRDNAREARTALPIFEKQFVRYALCYLELNRALIQVRGSLAHFAREYDMEDMSKAIQVNNGTGLLLQRAHRERKTIMEKRLRIERVKGLLQHFDPLMEMLGEDLPRMMGHDGDHQLTLFKGAVRKQEFARARSLVSKWSQEWLRQAGNTVIDMAEKYKDELIAQDGLMLHSGELTLIASFLKADEERINHFMAKYNVPYMVFQYQNLLHQGYLLGRVGSIEGLIIQHAKILSLAARPHSDAEQAKQQEQAILVPLRGLLQTKFNTLSAIFDDMETILAILEKLFAQTRDYLASTTA